jgi:predicted metal-dependent hydrolase
LALSEKIIEHETFGKVTLIKSSRARRISITMKPLEPLRVTIPVLASFKRAEEFLQEKEKWILKNLDKLKKLEEQRTFFDRNSEFSTHEHELKIVDFDEAAPKVSLRDRKIFVQLPAGTDIQSEEIQEMIRWGVQAAWRKEAKKYLPARLGELSRKHHLPFNKVVIKNNRSRWGSCSARNNINLSLHLMRLPDHLVDYVLIHELVHTVHKNHSKKFWKQLERIEPQARALDRELKDYRIEIY